MSIETVKQYFKKFGRENDILEFPVSSATVELAAQALNTAPAHIAKTLAFKDGENCILIVTAGNTKIDNKKFKQEFGFKAKMLSPEETLEMTGHAVGGVCPFGVPANVKSYTDISLKNYDFIYPACGSSNSAIKLTCDEIFKYSNAEKWVDACSVKE